MKLQFKNGDVAEGTAQEIADLLSRIKSIPSAPPPPPPVIQPRNIRIRKAPLDAATKKLCAYIVIGEGKKVTGLDLAPIIGAKSPSGVGPMLRSIRHQLNTRGVDLDEVMQRDPPAPGTLATWLLSPNEKLTKIITEEAET